MFEQKSLISLHISIGGRDMSGKYTSEGSIDEIMGIGRYPYSASAQHITAPVTCHLPAQLLLVCLLALLVDKCGIFCNMFVRVSECVGMAESS